MMLSQSPKTPDLTKKKQFLTTGTINPQERIKRFNQKLDSLSVLIIPAGPHGQAFPHTPLTDPA